MGGIYLHDTKSADALSKVDANIAAAEESSKKRAEARTAKNEERVQKHEELVQQVEKLVQEAVEYRMV
jgi:hypothetical protein